MTKQLVTLAALGLFAAGAYADDIVWTTIDGGGGVCTDGVYTIEGGTIGQPDASGMTGGGYTLLGGYWSGGTDGPCDTIDFNNDGLFPDTTDIDDFLSVFSGGPCSNDPYCNGIDFNNDGLFPDTTDIDSLLNVFSGGPCL